MKKGAFNFVLASMCIFGVSQGVAQTNPIMSPEKDTDFRMIFIPRY